MQQGETTAADAKAVAAAGAGGGGEEGWEGG
jgi:hypothetical protein